MRLYLRLFLCYYHPNQEERKSGGIIRLPPVGHCPASWLADPALGLDVFPIRGPSFCHPKATFYESFNHEKFDIDGVIWAINFQEAHEPLPDALRKCLRAEGAQAFTVELLAILTRQGRAETSPEELSFSNVIRSLQEFDELSQEGEFLLFFEPPSLDERIINQFALFSVMPNCERLIDDSLGQHPHLFRRIIILAAKKWAFRDKLDQCNITERLLFPGLYGLGSRLRRHYSPKVEVKNVTLTGQTGITLRTPG